MSYLLTFDASTVRIEQATLFPWHFSLVISILVPMVYFAFKPTFQHFGARRARALCLERCVRTKCAILLRSWGTPPYPHPTIRCASTGKGGCHFAVIFI
jgi:hypothetical protein